MKLKSSLLPPVPIIKSVTDMRYQSREIVKTLVKDGESIYLTKDSDPVGIILPIKTYNSMRRQLQELEDALDAKMMDELIKNDDGKYYDWEEVKRELDKKHKQKKRNVSSADKR